MALLFVLLDSCMARENSNAIPSRGCVQSGVQYNYSVHINKVQSHLNRSWGIWLEVLGENARADLGPPAKVWLKARGAH